jgi:hypothetical protein
MNVAAFASFLSSELYSRRFFPYYTYCMCAGLDAEGKTIFIDYYGLVRYLFYTCTPYRVRYLNVKETALCTGSTLWDQEKKLRRLVWAPDQR